MYLMCSTQNVNQQHTNKTETTLDKTLWFVYKHSHLFIHNMMQLSFWNMIYFVSAMSLYQALEWELHGLVGRWMDTGPSTLEDTFHEVFSKAPTGRLIYLSDHLLTWQLWVKDVVFLWTLARNSIDYLYFIWFSMFIKGSCMFPANIVVGVHDTELSSGLHGSILEVPPLLCIL